MIEKYYNIQDVLKFKIVSKTNFIHRLFSNLDIELKNFECNKVKDLDFSVEIGPFEPSKKDCYIFDENYYLKEDYLYCKKDSYKVAKWKFELSDFEKGITKVKISSNHFGEMFISPFIIGSIIQLKMSEKGYPLVHASCISKDDRGYLFSARGGGGKTTIALNLLEEGYSYLGDNFTILHKNTALGFLSPLNIFTYNLTPLIERNLGFTKRSMLKIKNIIYKMTYGNVKFFTQMDPSLVFPDSIIKKTKLTKVFYLIPREKINVEKINKKELIDRLLVNQKMDFPYFSKYITEYSNAFPDSKLANHWERYKENLNNNLSDNIPIYKLEVPKKYNEKIIQEVLELTKSDK